MRAYVGDDDSLWKPIPSYFPPGTPLYTQEGGDILKGPPKVDAAKRLGFGESMPHDAPELQDALADYIKAKRKIPRDRDRHLSEVMIADVISIYAEDVALKDARPKEVRPGWASSWISSV